MDKFNLGNSKNKTLTDEEFLKEYNKIYNPGHSEPVKTKKGYSWFVVTILLLLVFFTMLISTVLILQTASRIRSQVVVETTEEIQKNIKSRIKQQDTETTTGLSEIIYKTADDYHIDPALIKAIVQIESNGKMNAERFEKNSIHYARKVKREDKDLKKLASSHCAMQIMGYRSELEYQTHWSELYNPQTCIEVGTAIVAKCAEKHGSIAAIGKCYNGSIKYGKKLETLYKKIA